MFFFSNQVSAFSPTCLLSQHLFTRGEIAPERFSKAKPRKSFREAGDNKKREVKKKKRKRKIHIVKGQRGGEEMAGAEMAQ